MFVTSQQAFPIFKQPSMLKTFSNKKNVMHIESLLGYSAERANWDLANIWFAKLEGKVFAVFDMLFTLCFTESLRSGGDGPAKKEPGSSSK
jgi:hypothetical protein